MRYISFLIFLILLPGILLAQEVDSLNSEINQLNQNKNLIESQIDSLETEREQLVNKISELRGQVNKIKLESEREKGVPTRISMIGGRLRDKPSSNGNVIVELEENDEVLIYDWFQKPYVKASYNGEVGYISYGALKENKFVRQIKSQIKQKELQKIQENNPKLARLIKKYGESTAKRLIDGEIWIGMTDEMAREALGRPNDVNRTTTSYSVREQWVYPNGKYLYFEDGVLDSWQE
ncbi:hypothetical protein [Fodinibius sp. Rm-B-1B1-1]|uniref:DUF948 domain-containing protein n=1 Tax=Fodinibius alkaliphilus TaxID=3140241 RepID=UPI00315A9B57